MKKVLFIIASCIAISIVAQDSTNISAKNFEIKIRDVNEIHMLYYEFTGPYDQSFNNFGKLMEYINKNQLPMGPYSLGIFYDDPEKVSADKLRSDIGYMLAGKVEPTEDYKYKYIPACKAVSVKYKSMEEIMSAYQAISKYIMNNKLKTQPYSIEIYNSFDPGTIDTEILFLIK